LRVWLLAAGLVSLVDPALAPVDSRVLLPAEAPDTSAPVRLEPLAELLGAVLLEPFAELLLGLADAPPALGEAWAKAPVAAPAARTVAAQSVVIIRIGHSS
jgi:hypothetical protein